jgi:hypothetical protein
MEYSLATRRKKMQLGKLNFSEMLTSGLGNADFSSIAAGLTKPTLMASAGQGIKVGSDFPQTYLNGLYKSRLPSYLDAVAPQGQTLQLESGYNTRPATDADRKARDVAGKELLGRAHNQWLFWRITYLEAAPQ